MHPFYSRMATVFKQAGSNRSKFCKKYEHKYQTLQSYWNSDKLPPGNVLVDLSIEFNVSLDVLLFGKVLATAGLQNPTLARLTVLLKELSEQELLKVEGAVRMMQFISATKRPSDQADSAVQAWSDIEELVEHTD